MKAVAGAITKIYVENGVFGFWIGNGLSVAKILPESAIKFMTYETSVSIVLPSRSFWRDSFFVLSSGCRNGSLPSTGITSRILGKYPKVAGSCPEVLAA